jgi:hypothetical protein
MDCTRGEEDLMASTETGAPTTKVMSGAVGAAIATIAIWVFSEATGKAIPGGVEIAITTIITLVFGYFTPPPEGDRVIPAR